MSFWLSNICEAVLISLFWAPDRHNKLLEMRSSFPFNLTGKSTMAFKTAQSWHILKSWNTGGGPEQEFQPCFATRLN